MFMSGSFLIAIPLQPFHLHCGLGFAMNLLACCGDITLGWWHLWTPGCWTCGRQAHSWTSHFFEGGGTLHFGLAATLGHMSPPALLPAVPLVISCLCPALKDFCFPPMAERRVAPFWQNNHLKSFWMASFRLLSALILMGFELLLQHELFKIEVNNHVKNIHVYLSDVYWWYSVYQIYSTDNCKRGYYRLSKTVFTMEVLVLSVAKQNQHIKYFVLPGLPLWYLNYQWNLLWVPRCRQKHFY